MMKKARELSQSEWKLPPRIKVLEAAGAIADGRVKKIGEKEAKVVSSAGRVRVYTVKWNGTDAISSDDNGSVYRNYLGYPSIAFLMLEGILPYDAKIGEALKGIKWKEMNDKFKNYFMVEQFAKEVAAKHDVKPEEIDSFVKKVLEKIKMLKLKKL